MGDTEQITCEHCGYLNPPGALICRRCYRLLTNNGRLAGAKQGTTSKLGTKILDSNIPKDAEAPVIEETEKPFENILRIRIVGADDEIVKGFRAGTLLIGRSDTVRRIKPDIDLNPFEAYSHGVSRTHALLRKESNRLLIQDLDSANHTYLNGQRLSPHIPTQVHHGDVLRLGMLVTEVRFE